MRYCCPNSNCESFNQDKFVVKDGFYKRSNDSKLIQRFKCKSCKKRFSSATFTFTKNQKKRRVNGMVFKLLASGVSIRRCAKLLGINRKTVERKIIYLADRARRNQRVFLRKLQKEPVKKLQFDDLITIEHTKLKPLSVTIAVDAKTHKVLGTEVSTIPAFGHLAEKSRAKYGYRASSHKKSLDLLLSNIQKAIHPKALIQTDEHKLYQPAAKKYFPEAEHKQYKGGRGCVAGQGELKKLKYDPLFALNHTCAMFRANINRLIRKTWCTSKLPWMLKNHIDLYVDYHNRFIRMPAPS